MFVKSIESSTLPSIASDLIVSPEHAESADSHSAIVLIPHAEIDSERLKLRLIGLGLDQCQQITLLGSATNSLYDLSRVASQLRAVGMRAGFKQTLPQEGWAQAVARIANPGDYAVCHAEYRGEQISREIFSKLGLVVYVLSGVYPEPTRRFAKIAGRGLYEMLPLGLIAAFFWLQVQISVQTSGILNSVLLIFSVLVELGLLVIWSLFLNEGRS